MSATKLITVSPSPHNYGDESVSKIMYRVIWALVPAFAVSLVFFGVGALIVTAIAITSCVAFEYLIAKYIIKSKPTVWDGSAILTGLLLAFNVPSNLPIWIIILGSLVAIGIGKMSFGGLGKNPFNPALVGRVFLLISFPVQMTSWPKAVEARWAYLDATTGATPLGLLKEGLMNGKPLSELMDQIPEYSQLFLGNMGGSLGEISALALILGGAYLLWKKIITWHIPVSVLGTVVAFTGIMWLVNPDQYIDPAFHLLSGGMLLGAIYMATDMVSSPMTPKGQIIFGVGIGVLTCVIRLFGAYPEGVSFAILIMNAFVPLLDKYIKPKRFGEVKK
ncbi:MAG: RnfABCDGE type electron transport complex subunit D [Bacteroidetes bacterium]|jgi:Na+-translocating ferredoxin:NAD+ oxidoreductase subunit D|nr:RnfABCDGE type electron transport complex subunit D [Bacteroidota bacterium]MBT4398042.1 RnfABCDGE type electron transport complex subunit D [Bacteroidota bacterium]MBT4408667.1 RnfABCDGE type electron transport complex subunit D [Bacteroidota bacterium]MBT5425508.1 RnfABCDGE type electron transport complex subunit D [Bacteroidota bacterium]MBT7093610.1 RnfABCDGE type electron transport complex subunit D [Bacteroidota bacterium]